MQSRFPRPTLAVFAGLLNLLLLAAPLSAATPRLFLTETDIARAREASRPGGPFASLAETLTQKARTERVEDLPPLETAWWQSAQKKPWRDTYPEIFHHTWIVPQRWAELARTCARAHLLTGDSALAAKAKRVLLDLSAYTFEFEHYDVGMNYTVWMTAALETYELLSPQFSNAERARMEACFRRFLAAVIKNDDYWIQHEPGGSLNNHYAWHKLGRAMIGLHFGEHEHVEAALHGPKGVAFMLRHGFKDDGLWLEGSIPYQFAAAAPLLQTAVILANAQYPTSLFSWTTADGRSLRQSYDALFPLLMPDRTLPTIGDCYARRPHLAEYPDWELLHRHTSDPRYAWLLGDRSRSATALFSGAPSLPPCAPPPQYTRIWTGMGYAALRSHEGTNYWSGEGWTVFATFSSQPVHDHADKLSLQIFADGHLWCPDPEARPSAEHAFSSPTQAQLNRQTLCHNTLIVDGESQRFSQDRLDLIDFVALPAVKRLTMGDLKSSLYPGVRQQRTILVRDEYVLDFFEVTADRTRNFTWLTHIDGTPRESTAGDWQPATLPPGPAWSYLRGFQQVAHPSSTFGETFTLHRASLRLDLVGAEPFTIAQAGFPRDDSPRSTTIPLRLFSQRATKCWWLAVYRRGIPSHAPITLRVRPGELRTWEALVAFAGQTNAHVLPALP